MNQDFRVFIKEKRRKTTKVVQNFSMDGGHRNCYRHPTDKKKNITINDFPMMLLPRAQIRTNYNATNCRRPFIIIPDDGLHDIHLSTISVSDWMEHAQSHTGPRTTKRVVGMIRPNSGSVITESVSGIRKRYSDSDSGYSSFKRCVTFEDLSLGSTAVTELIDGLFVRSVPSHQSVKSDQSLESIQLDECGGSEGEERLEHLPIYLDSFGEDKPLFTALQPSAAAALIHNAVYNQPTQDDHGCLQYMLRSERYTGGTQLLIRWIFAKWDEVGGMLIRTIVTHTHQEN